MWTGTWRTGNWLPAPLKSSDDSRNWSAELKLCILKSTKNYHEKYAASCRELGVDFDIADGLSPDWMEQINASGADGILVRPPGEYPELRALYQERLRIIANYTKKPLYPTLEELELYENKRYLADWLDIHGYPHPRTAVCGSADAALNFIRETALPLVFKSNVGSAGLGVKIVKSRFLARKMIRRAFGGFHPALAGGITPRKFRVLPLRGLAQKHYLIIQKYHSIKWEWRIIRIGESYFAHKKLLKGEMASGSDLVGWEAPPVRLLDMVREITDRHGFRSMAVDIFETTDGEFLINEMQSLFGSYNDSQMYIDGKPGRFIHKKRILHI